MPHATGARALRVCAVTLPVAIIVDAVVAHLGGARVHRGVAVVTVASAAERGREIHRDHGRRRR